MIFNKIFINGIKNEIHKYKVYSYNIVKMIFNEIFINDNIFIIIMIIFIIIMIFNEMVINDNIFITIMIIFIIITYLSP